MRKKSVTLVDKIKKRLSKKGIQFVLAMTFTVVAVICMTLISVILHKRFQLDMRQTKIESTEQIINQVGANLESYLRSMMRISDAMYYSAIKSKDISTDSIISEMNLLYEANKDNLVSIACFDGEGNLLGAAPADNLKENNNITEQNWFLTANSEMENFHFSLPHVQNIFLDSSHRYYWVISLSRTVELTARGSNQRGILLVDMNYSSIEQQFKKVNAATSLGYCYLMTKDGEIIYHPKQELIYSDLVQENHLLATQYEDGTHQEIFQGEERVVSVRTVGYTGWKIVSVIPSDYFTLTSSKTQIFVLLLVIISICILVYVNQIVSAQIAKPIQMLEDSVKEIESGNLDIQIHEGGSYEIQRLGKTIQSMLEQIKELMEEYVKEQEQKRKMELDALQSQINPHFLYNTLDAIVWMIESERYDEATTIVTQLASLFRISLSRGRTIISIRDEISHARNYCNIQMTRYKNKFNVLYEIEDEIYECATVKLIMQPILENAIYYGMEYMDGEGIITIKGHVTEVDVFIEIIDNGLGMQEETASLLLTETTRIRRRGTGVGLINVNQRIQLRFGEKYGLKIESEPDVGTKVIIHLPKILYAELNEEEIKNEK